MFNGTQTSDAPVLTRSANFKQVTPPGQEFPEGDEDKRIRLETTASQNLDIRGGLIVKFYEIILFFTCTELHGSPRMQIHLARDVVGHERSPLDRGLKGFNVVLK